MIVPTIQTIQNFNESASKTMETILSLKVFFHCTRFARAGGTGLENVLCSFIESFYVIFLRSSSFFVFY